MGTVLLIGEDMVPESSGEMEARQGQSADDDRVRRRRGRRPAQKRGRRERDARPVEMSKRCRRRKNRRAHTGARQPVRGEESTPAAGEMRLGIRTLASRERVKSQ